MRVRRDVSSIPFRSASETWQCIIDLITGDGSVDADQLTAAAGVMGSILTDEHPSVRPIVVEGVGPQLRVYCRYGLKAISEGGAVDALTWNPTAGNWTLHVPCDDENRSWVTAALKASPRIHAFDVAAEYDKDDEALAPHDPGAAIVIDWNVKGRD